MKLYSSWYSDNDKQQNGSLELTLDVLIKELKRAERVCIISAYYSTAFITNALDEVNKTKPVSYTHLTLPTT